MVSKKQVKKENGLSKSQQKGDDIQEDTGEQLKKESRHLKDLSNQNYQDKLVLTFMMILMLIRNAVFPE